MSNDSVQYPRILESNDPTILAGIYEPDCNLVVWRRELPEQVNQEANSLLKSRRSLDTACVLGEEDSTSLFLEFLKLGENQTSLGNDIKQLVEMFCCLFQLKNAGLRFKSLTHAMCPKFHVDFVPCRLVTTYAGAATEYLPNDLVDRSWLGSRNLHSEDRNSGIFKSQEHIRQLNPGDVALIKGENWEGNEGKGLVHRSPELKESENRPLLTMDLAA